VKGSNSLAGPLADPAADAGHAADHPDRVYQGGAFTAAGPFETPAQTRS